MPTDDITGLVRRMAETIASARGLEVFQVEYKPGGQLLRVFLDRPSGQVGLDDCSAVSGQLSAQLDEQDLIPHAYRLEVSSPGLDRPLRDEDDFIRFRGEFAKLALAQPVNGVSSLRGRIGECRNGMLRLETDGGEPLWMPFSQLRSARLDPAPPPPGPGSKAKKKR
jgi:ribosome maturation factor RimP